MKKSIHTTIGLALLAQAEATGSQIRLTHAVVGDGNGKPVEVNADQQQLVREVYRTELNRIYQDPENNNKFTAEFIIPVTVGGFVIREMGLYDSNGNLFVVGNCEDIYKPNIDNGTFQDYTFRMPFFVGNGENVDVTFDPNVVIATHTWVLNTLTPALLVPGGTSGQVLKKVSNADGDFVWGDPTATDAYVTTIEEEQDLIADQLIINFAKVSTNGVAIYIDGKRLAQKTGNEGWQATSDTSITLGKSYAGSKLLAVQNDQLGNAPFPLAKQNNLSDVQNPMLARQNLGVMSTDETKFSDCPPGTIITLAMSQIPMGYRIVRCNGAALPRAIYSELFAAIGTLYGAGDGVNTFNVPDFRAEFPRYADDGKGIDANRQVGSKQSATSVLMGDPTSSHAALVTLYNKKDNTYETIKNALNGETTTAVGTDLSVLSSAAERVDPATVQAVTMSVRPRNAAVLACIRY